jgi:hypothetical protein
MPESIPAKKQGSQQHHTGFFACISQAAVKAVAIPALSRCYP